MDSRKNGAWVALRSACLPLYSAWSGPWTFSEISTVRAGRIFLSKPRPGVRFQRVRELRYMQPLVTVKYYLLVRYEAIASAVGSMRCLWVSRAQLAAELRVMRYALNIWGNMELFLGKVNCIWDSVNSREICKFLLDMYESNTKKCGRFCLNLKLHEEFDVKKLVPSQNHVHDFFSGYLACHISRTEF